MGKLLHSKSCSQIQPSQNSEPNFQSTNWTSQFWTFSFLVGVSQRNHWSRIVFTVLWWRFSKSAWESDSSLQQSHSGIKGTCKTDLNYSCDCIFKAASTPSHNLQFQAEYLRIRTEFLQCLIQLIYTCNTLCIVPPPAIAASIVQNTRDEYQRHGYITNQLRKCVKEFKNCSELYWKLYQTAFDADPATLENMQMWVLAKSTSV